MRSEKRTEITLRSRQTLVIRSSPGGAAVRCTQCAAGAQMISPDAATAAVRMSTRAVYRLVEEGKLHYVETENGTLYICLNSLIRAAEQGA
jgi:hypothetical protein